MTPAALRQNREFKVLEIHLRDIKSQGYKNAEIIVGDYGWPVVTFTHKGKRYYYNRDADLFVTRRADACEPANQPERHRSRSSSYRCPSGMEPKDEQEVTETELSEITEELKPAKNVWKPAANPLTPPSEATLRKYSITAADYMRMLAEQDGKCAICRRPPKVRRLNIDHCHKHGHVRGLLCYSCNYGLGVFRDVISSFENAVIYLKKNYRS